MKIGKMRLIRKRKIENKNINCTKIWKLIFQKFLFKNYKYI